MIARPFTALLLLLALCLALHAPATAQEEPAEPGVSRIDQLGTPEEEAPGSLAPTIMSPDLLGEEGIASLQEALKAYYDYRISGYAHRERVFAWQLLSSRIIFVVVIFLVMVGIYFSWLQFSRSLKGTKGDEFKETTFEASTTGFKVSSPILGVIILAMSLAFFYLYLAFVYTISEIV